MSNKVEKKFTKLVNNEYHGDFNAAARDILLNRSRKEIKRLFPTMTEEECRKFGLVYVEIMKEKYPGGTDLMHYEDYFHRKLHLSPEELKNAPVNPYLANLKRAGLVSVLAVVGLSLAAVAAKSLGIDPSVLGWGGAILTTGISSSFAGTIINAIKFGNMKRIYKSKEYLNKQEEYLANKEQIDKIRDLLYVNNVELDERDGVKREL